MSSGSDDFNDDSSSGSGHKTFKFDIVDGKVTAVYELKDGVLKPKSIDDDGTETYVVEANGDVVRTEVNFGTGLRVMRMRMAISYMCVFPNSGRYHRMPAASYQNFRVSCGIRPRMAMILSRYARARIARAAMVLTIL